MDKKSRSSNTTKEEVLRIANKKTNYIQISGATIQEVKEKAQQIENEIIETNNKIRLLL